MHGQNHIKFLMQQSLNSVSIPAPFHLATAKLAATKQLSYGH